MKEVFYSIHDLLTLRIANPSRHLIPDLNGRYSYFETPQGGTPDIDVEIGDFSPRLTDCLSLDHKYFVRENFLFMEDSDKKLTWKVQIEGFEEERIKIAYYAAPRVYSRFPWMLFPDLILHLYVLQPLVETLLLKKGWMVLHAGGVDRRGNALLIAGRGGSHKTNFVVELMKRGYRYVGDDMVLVGGSTVRSFPLSIGMFDFIYRNLGSDELGSVDRLRLFLFLRRQRERSFPVVDRSNLACLNMLLLRNGPSGGYAESPAREAVTRMLLFNQFMERTSYVSHKTVIGKFLDAYRFVFPASRFFPEKGAWYRRLEETFRHIPYRVLTVPREWDRSLTDQLLTEAEEV